MFFAVARLPLRDLGTQVVLDRLAEPSGVEDIEFTVVRSDEMARPATFD